MVILRMGLLEIFTLSFCSENIYKAVQRLLHRNFDRYLLKVRLATEHRKEINRTCHHSFIIDDKAFWILKTPSNRNFKRECFAATIHETPFEGYFLNDSMITYWDDVEVGVRMMIRYFSTMFGQDILHVHYAHSPKTVSSDLAIIDFLINRQGRIEAADLLISKPKVVLEPLFERLKTVETLWFEVDRTLPMTVPLGLTWEHEELVLYNADWLTVPHLLLMNCKRLIIHNCLLQHFDVNVYLRHFVNGAVPLVEHLTIESVRQDMMEVLEDIECEENPNRVFENFTRRYQSNVDHSNGHPPERGDNCHGVLFTGNVFFDFDILS